MDNFCGSNFWPEASPDGSNVTAALPGVADRFPGVTPCFEATLLVWVPSAFVWLSTPFQISALLQSRLPAIPHNWLNLSKTVVAAVLCVLSLVELFLQVDRQRAGEDVFAAFILGPAIRFISLSLVLGRIQFGRKRGQSTSGMLFIYWLFTLISYIIILSSAIQNTIHHRSERVLTHLYISVAVAFGVLLQVVFASLVDKSDTETAVAAAAAAADTNMCPEDTASFLSVVTFWWFTRLIIKGYKEPLKHECLWSLSPRYTSRFIMPMFMKEWRKEVAKCQRVQKTKVMKTVPEMIPEEDEEPTKPLKEGAGGDSTATQKLPQPSLVRALVRAFWDTFLTAALFKLLGDIMIFVNPQLLQRLIAFTSDKSAERWRGFVIAILMFVFAQLQSLFLHHYFHRCFIVGMRLRTAIVLAIYNKSLRLSSAARRTTTAGEITNLMAVDAQRFMDLCVNVNLVWSAPFQMCVAMFFLWRTLGPSILAGVAVMFAVILLNALIARKTRTLQVAQMKKKDQRIKLIHELLNGIKVLKLYAWEGCFQQKVVDVRKQELHLLKNSAYLNAVSSLTWTCAPFMVSLTTFAVYVLSSPDNVLDAEKAFVSLSLFNILRFPLSMLPQFIASLVQASVSVKRVQTFLKSEELDPSSVTHISRGGIALSINKGTFCWDKDSAEATLQDIKLCVKEGSLVAVVGSVGSGKTSLLSALLGEMVKVKGQVKVKGSVAYVAQQAWIQNASLKDNILFGKPLQNSLYYKVLENCELLPDLKMLPNADLTEIGEKGINLSGGQKQRISVARAVYTDADIYLLDDPLSAVDAHVGKHIFNQVIGPKGMLKNKTRLLVTHGINLLPDVDQIVVLVEGRVSEVGSYQELLRREGAFAHFLKNYLLDILVEEEQDEVFELDAESKIQRDEIKSQIGNLIDENELAERRRSREVERQLSGSYEWPTASPLASPSHHQRFHRPFSYAAGASAAVASPARHSPLHRQFSEMPLRSRQVEALSGVGFSRQLSERTSGSGTDSRPFSRMVSPLSHDGSSGSVPGPRRHESLYSRQTSESMLNGRFFDSQMSQSLTSEDDDDVISLVSQRFPRQRFTRQITIADDECHPPPALIAKIMEVDRLIPAEMTQTGNVKLGVFCCYMQYIGHLVALLIMLCYLFASAASVGSSFWLSNWSDDAEQNSTLIATSKDLRLGVYAALGFTQGLFILLASIAFAKGRVRASCNLHADMLSAVLRAPVKFFDRTPLGRISNRFTRDVDTVDAIIPVIFAAWMQTLLSSVCTLTVISVSTPPFLAVLVPLGLFYYLVQRIYVATSRQLKRLESVSRSPIYSHFSESLQGAVTIRAYRQEARFTRNSEDRVDDNQRCYYPGIVSNRWLAVRLEFVGNCIVLFAAFFAVMSRDSLNPGMVGLSITYALTITGTLNVMVRMTSELETNIVAVERIKEYSDHEQEAAWVCKYRPGNDWPSEGRVVMHQYSTCYPPRKEPVLTDISCSIKAGEKIGIVGRTGAGKSSLMLGLFRIIEPTGGYISIDGVNIKDIGLHDLRSKLTIIPQDPVLFAGSLRMNLDPFSEYTDADLWTALHFAHLKDFVLQQSDELQFECTEGGENLSVGQRQLVCLARALLRKTKILVLDEATASVDLEMDSLIQLTIRNEFKECTIFTIAHRLNTIMDYSRIMVLDKGSIAEFDAPDKLLATKKGIFYSMAVDAGLVE